MARILAFALLLLTPLALANPLAAQTLADVDVEAASQDMLFGAPLTSDAGIARLRAYGKTDAIPAMGMALRYRGPNPVILEAISHIAGETIGSWHDLMLWWEAQPELTAHPSYRNLKLELLGRVDPAFARFIGGDRSKPENMHIRLSEVVWGGVRVDGIPSLDNPKLIPAAEADYMKDDDLVFGVAINGDVRAYPIRIMAWHEMFNDTIGGVPVALAYCTLCGAGILFETQPEGHGAPFVFGSSGFLYRSNKLMFDRASDSLWNQFTGKPVSGPLKDSGIELKLRPVVIQRWADWRGKHPETKVLSLETGFDRDYGSGVAYKQYFASPELMFPAVVGDESVAKRKDFVFGLRDVAASRAWPVAAFAEEPVINDAVGPRNVVLIGDADGRTVRAYERQADETFAATDAADVVRSAAGDWRLTEDALIGPDGATRARVPGRLGYWFAWNGYYGAESTLYGAQ